MKKINYYLGIAFLLASLTIFGQSKDSAKYSFSLQQAIDYSLSNNTRIENAIYDEEIASNKVKEIFGIGLPQLSGSFDIKDYLEIPTSLIPAQIFNPTAPADAFLPVQFGTKYNATAGISASQLIFSSSYFVGLQATKTYQELTQKSTKRTKIETAVAVTKAYYSALINKERMKLIEYNITRLKKLSEDTKALYANGFVEKVDNDRITVLYNNLLIEQDKVKRLLDLTSVLLKYQMGMDQSSALTLTDELSNTIFQSETISLDKPTYSNRIEYSLFESQKKAAELTLKDNKLSFLPSLAVYGSLNANAQRNKFDLFDTKQRWFPIALVGLTLNVPIFSGGQKHFKIQQSKLALDKANNDLKFMQQSIDLELASARITLQNASVSLENQKKNIELAEEVYRISKLKYDQGVGSNLEILNAEASLKEAQANYLSALYDALIAKADYQKANGTLIK